MIRLREPVVRGNSVDFSWSVEPDRGFYIAPRFTLEFPDSVEVDAVPAGLWLRVMILCLHTHWALLRPCRVELPRTLPEREREFWLRMIDAGVWTLENDRDEPGAPSFAQRTRRAVELAGAGAPAEPLEPAAHADGAVASFSAGRDSLTQAGLLKEIGVDPLLVTTRSKRVGSLEFETDRFRAVMSEIERLGFERVEVGSDIRTCFVNDHPTAARHGLAVSELTDTLLYFAVCWAVAWARGAGAVYLASEAEAQESVRRDGTVVQIEHFAYTAATQRALSELIAPTGVSYGGLIASLEHFHTQRLLSNRYPELRRLRYSCYHQAAGEDVCSRCFTCFASSLHLLADDVAPSEIGVDLGSALEANADWRPSGGAGGEINSAVGRLYCERMDNDLLRTIRALEPAAVSRHARGGALTAEQSAAFETLLATAFAAPEPPPEPGYRAGYLELLEQPLRERLDAIFAEHFAPEPAENYRSLLANTLLLSDWIAAPLKQKAPAGVSGQGL